MHIGIPQFILLFFMAISLIVGFIKHGESRGEYNAGVSLLDFIIVFILLSAGGFFR